MRTPPVRRASRRLVTAGAIVIAASTACSDRPPTAPSGARVTPGAPSAEVARTTGTASDGAVYVESNDPTPGRNSVLAYHRAADGSLTPLAGSPFLTGGTGVANPTQMLGPDDLDQNIVADRTRRLLFVVNGGSNTIAVLHINADWSLTPVPGSPFPSAGSDPSSVGLAGDKVYVVNKAMDPAQGNGVPNYTGFTLAASGALTPVPGSTQTSVVGASPSQAYIDPTHTLLFGADFLAPTAPTPAGSLRAFHIDANGTLTPAPGTPMQIPGEKPTQRMALGLWSHPNTNVLYVGFTLQNKLGVYTYAPNGALTFQRAVPNSGKAICWVFVTPDGRSIYTVNTLTNSVSRYAAANPLVPSEQQHLPLRAPGPSYLLMGMPVPTSQAFQEGFAPDGRFLYVVSQHTNPDFSAPNGNKLHTLVLGFEGRLSEPTEPLQLPVSTRVRPQGVVVF